MRKYDALIAEHWLGWQWVNMHGSRDIFTPPLESEMTDWTAIYGKDGIPNYLPNYYEQYKEKKIYLLEDPYYTGVMNYINDSGVQITWDREAPDGSSRYVFYQNIEGTLALIQPVKE